MTIMMLLVARVVAEDETAGAHRQGVATMVAKDAKMIVGAVVAVTAVHDTARHQGGVVTARHHEMVRAVLDTARHLVAVTEVENATGLGLPETEGAGAGAEIETKRLLKRS